MRKFPTINVWREPIDGETTAICAHAGETRWGACYEFSAFMMIDRKTLQKVFSWNWKRAGIEQFQRQLVAHCGGSLPYVRAVDKPQTMPDARRRTEFV